MDAQIADGYDLFYDPPLIIAYLSSQFLNLRILNCEKKMTKKWNTPALIPCQVASMEALLLSNQ